MASEPRVRLTLPLAGLPAPLVVEYDPVRVAVLPVPSQVGLPRWLAAILTGWNLTDAAGVALPLTEAALRTQIPATVVVMIAQALAADWPRRAWLYPVQQVTRLTCTGATP